MTVLKENPTLADYQNYVKQICAERGWNKNSPTELFLLFSEEVGELAKAMRYRQKLFVEDSSKRAGEELAGEFADVFSYLLDLANYYGVDLETAFRDKEKRNAGRVWK